MRSWSNKSVFYSLTSSLLIKFVTSSIMRSFTSFEVIFFPSITDTPSDLLSGKIVPVPDPDSVTLISEHVEQASPPYYVYI